jgi:hypothetical protein
MIGSRELFDLLPERSMKRKFRFKIEGIRCWGFYPDSPLRTATSRGLPAATRWIVGNRKSTAPLFQAVGHLGAIYCPCQDFKLLFQIAAQSHEIARLIAEHGGNIYSTADKPICGGCVDSALRICTACNNDIDYSCRQHHNQQKLAPRANLKFVVALLEAEIYVEHRNFHGQMASHVAAFLGPGGVAELQLRLQSSADVHIKDRGQCTAGRGRPKTGIGT